MKVNDCYKLKQTVFTNKILGRKRPWNTEKDDHLHDCCTDRLDQDSLEVSLLVQQSCQIENHAQNFCWTLPVTFSDKWKVFVKSMPDFLDPQKQRFMEQQLILSLIITMIGSSRTLNHGTQHNQCVVIRVLANIRWYKSFLWFSKEVLWSNLASFADIVQSRLITSYPIWERSLMA